MKTMPETIIRRAALRDAEPIVNIVNHFATLGLMLPRTAFETAESIRDFVVAEQEGRVVGTAALGIYTMEAAEVRSRAVDPAAQSTGLGRQLVAALEEEALVLGLSDLFAFTYVPGFFAKLGFREVDRARLPLKAWKDCLKCPKFTACDEIAVEKSIRDRVEPRADTPKRGQPTTPPIGIDLPVLVPTIRRDF